MQILNDLVNWVKLTADKGIVFANTNPRPITLRVNSEKEVALYIHLDGEEDPRFLATYKGRDTLKFVVPGKFMLINGSVDVDAYVLSNDSAAVHRVALEEEVFTTLHEPRVRDENVERMMQAMQRNIERRVSYQLAAQQAQYEREMELVRTSEPPRSGTDSEDGNTGETEGGKPGGGESGSAETTNE